MNATIRAASALAAALALLAAGCSSDEKRPLTCDVDPERYGGCGRGAVAGTIELGEGGPEARTTVTLVGEGATSIGDSGDGAREFLIGRVPAGAWSLVAHAPGYVSRTIESVSVAAGQTTLIGAIVLEFEEIRAPAIVGTILLKGQADHRGTLVSLDDSSAVVGTAEDGSFRIDGVEPGPHRLIARHAGYETIVAAVVVPENDELSVLLMMEPVTTPGSLSGAITAAGTGAPLAGVTIRVGESYGAASAEDGSYTLAALPPGVYQVRAGLPGYEPQVFDGIVISPGEETTLDVSLERVVLPAALQGTARRMHSAHGTDSGIIVTVVGTDLVAATTPDGLWWINEVPPGVYDIEFADAFMPKVTVMGVVVMPEERTDVPAVELGPAKKITDGATLYSRVFPANRKALVWLPADPATYLFDGTLGELQKVADEPLEAIAVDADERYATLFGGSALYRLDLEDGVVEAVSAPAVTALISDRALTIFVGDDDLLYLLRAGDLEAEPRTPVAPGTMLSPGEPIDARRGWAFVRVGTGRMPVDFGGWAGPIGETIRPGGTAGTMAIVGFAHADDDGSHRELHRVEMETKSAELISSSVHADSSTSSVGHTMLFPHDPAGATWSISALDIDTGVVTPLETGVAEDFWFGDMSMVVKKGGQILWLRSDPPESGILCSSPSAEVFRSPVYGCMQGRTLRVFTPQQGDVTYATIANNPSINSWGLVSWTGSNGYLELRPYWATASMGATCPSPSIAALSNRNQSVILSCGVGAPSHLLDFVASRQQVLPAQTYFCSHEPELELAVCSFPCSGQTCIRMYDLSAGTFAEVTESASAAITTAWGSDRAVAIRTGTGEAFHGRAGASWEPPADPVPPEVFDCGLDRVRPAGAEADFSLWYDDSSQGVVCGSDGTSSAPFALSSTEVFRVGDSKRRFIGGWMVDLEDGSRTQLVSVRPTVVPYAGGIFVASNEGLLQATEEGDDDWIVAGRPVTGQAYYAGRPAFHVYSGSTYDLLVMDAPGNIRTLATNVSELRYGTGRNLFVHDAGGGVASVTVVENETLESWRMPLALMPNDAWIFEGDRLFFDTPTDEGVAFATARLEDRSAAILHSTAGGRAIADDGGGRWLFVADGWSWQEGDDEPRAVLAGETFRAPSAAGGATVFHAVRPNATYWIESDIRPFDPGDPGDPSEPGEPGEPGDPGDPEEN